MRLTKHIDPYNPNIDLWRLDVGGRLYKVTRHGDLIVYYIMKFGTEFSLRFSSKSKVRFGRIVNATEDTIDFEKISKREWERSIVAQPV